MRIRLLFALATLLAVPTALAQGRGMGGSSSSPDDPHDTIHTLLANHEAIERRVLDRPDGVETWTESDDPEVAVRIRVHVRQMKDRLQSGQPMRRWDPLFAAIFEHSGAIEMEIEDTPRGVRVVETSDDPEVVALIQQHAHRAVSEFVERGMDRAHESTPLPSFDATPMPSLPDFDDIRFATATLYQNDRYRVVGFAFREGQTLPEHATPVDAFLLITAGRAHVTVGGDVHDLGGGEGVVLPKDVPHTVEATEDTRALLIR